MKQKALARSKFRVINGGLHSAMTYGEIKIIAAPMDSPPFKVDGMVFEEDTYLIMSAKPEAAPREIHPLKLMAELSNLAPEKPGTVKVAGKNPIKFFAVVHDVDKDPTWREEWIEAALINLFRESEDRRIAALGLPLIGSKHGKLGRQRFMELLAGVLLQSHFVSLKKLWLIVGIPENARLINWLKSELEDIR